MADPLFDHYADEYYEALQRGLAVSGDGSEFFAQTRLRYLKRRLVQYSYSPRTALDFGCGVGTAAKHLIKELSVQRVLGVDPSSRSIDFAKQQHQGCVTDEEQKIRFELLSHYKPNADVDLVFCNGVFHHIAVDDRPKAMSTIASSMIKGGVFALWENSPFSLPARYVMSRIPFDRDAVMVWPSEARSLIRSAGLKVIGTEYYFIFPAFLKCLRFTESMLCRFPLGAQYMVLAVKEN